MKKKTRKVLSLDTASKVTGWALFVNGKYKCSGTIDLHKDKNPITRVSKMCLNIVDLIKEHNPTDVAIEEMPSTRNAKTTRMLSKIIGAVYYHCLINNIPYEEVSCTKWRGTLGIDKRKRDEAKLESVKRVKAVYGKDIKDDEADAINIGEAYCINYNIGRKGYK